MIKIELQIVAQISTIIDFPIVLTYRQAKAVTRYSNTCREKNKLLTLPFKLFSLSLSYFFLHYLDQSLLHEYFLLLQDFLRDDHVCCLHRQNGPSNGQLAIVSTRNVLPFSRELHSCSRSLCQV